MSARPQRLLPRQWRHLGRERTSARSCSNPTRMPLPRVSSSVMRKWQSASLKLTLVIFLQGCHLLVATQTTPRQKGAVKQCCLLKFCFSFFFSLSLCKESIEFFCKSDLFGMKQCSLDFIILLHAFIFENFDMDSRTMLYA